MLCKKCYFANSVQPLIFDSTHNQFMIIQNRLEWFNKVWLSLNLGDQPNSSPGKVPNLILYLIEHL